MVLELLRGKEDERFFFKNVENGRAKKAIEVWRSRRWSFEKMKHIFSGLLEIIFGSELWERNFFREETDSENVTFGHSIWEVALVAPIVFRRGADIPTNLAVLAERSARFSTNVSDYFGAKGNNRSSIEIIVAKEGRMGR
jgi:hypothetical protein